MSTQNLMHLRETIGLLQQQDLSVVQFCQEWRVDHAVTQQLPQRYAEVMENLLGRLESGSLFSEESCSFSQHELLAQLALWLDKAEIQIVKAI
ncbi:hypothetical protein [Undibacterium sp. Xuan67W]|uniref:hypothetical protein n=1 Tax=Undibacterium sp. Xuan67W TaxID=3413057 RepID=UPI003BF3D27B